MENQHQPDGAPDVSPAQYMERVHELLSWIELPQPDDTNTTENPIVGFDEELQEMELVFCFPNLSDDERSLISGARSAQRIVKVLSGLLNNPQHDFTADDRAKIETQLKDGQGLLRENQKALEKYGLRVKLTPFQERIFDEMTSKAESHWLL